MSVRTVQRYLKTTSFPERQARCDRDRSLLLAPFQAFLLEQYHQGCRHVRSLFAQLQQLGYNANGLFQDYQAVLAALTLSTSNGQVEGQVNRLKMLKRQMYGRAGLPLLQRRFLLFC